MAVTADVPLGDATFDAKFRAFQTDGPDGDVVRLHHHLGLPAVPTRGLGRPVFDQVPWTVYHSDDTWTYVGIPPRKGGPLHRVAVFSADHTAGRIYSPLTPGTSFTEGGFGSLTLFPTDQIVLGRVLAGREACYVHSSAVVVDGKGLLFVGHSGAGKSTITRLVGRVGEVLCDDRNIVRRWPDGVRVHGSWSHGEVPLISAGSAPLAAVLFLRQAPENRLVELPPGAAAVALASCVVRPLVTKDWWERTLDLVELVVDEVPCYTLDFDESGRVLPLLTRLVDGSAGAGRAEPVA